MSIKHFPSNPDLQCLKSLERKGVECIEEFINQLLQDPVPVLELAEKASFKDASLIFSAGTQGIPLRVLDYLEHKSVHQLAHRGYLNWEAEVEGAHTNTIRLNLRDHNNRNSYYWCAVTPSDGIFVLEYQTGDMNNAQTINKIR